MTDAILIGAAALIGAIGFRIRGGGLIAFGSTFAARSVWGSAVAVIATAATGDIRAVVLGPAAYLGAIPAWWSTIDMGRVEGSAPRDALLMLCRGLVWTAPIGAAALLVAPLGLAAAIGGVGLVAPAVYEIAWRGPSGIRHAARGPELAEWLFGGIIGAVVFASLGASA